MTLDRHVNRDPEEGPTMPDPVWLQEYHSTREYLHYRPSRKPDDHETHALTKDVAFNKHERNSGHHVSPLDNGMIQIGTDGLDIKLVQGIDEDALKRTLGMATRATIGWDPTDEQDDRDWAEMLKGGLQTALESQTVVFAVRGASRTATHQIVRSRRAAFHQSSQRASWLGDAPEVRMPESVWNASNPEVLRTWYRAIITAHDAYNAACEAGVSYQDARFILPEGTTSFIMMEYPLREFINVYAYRGCSMFQWEIVHIMRECRRLLLQSLESEELVEAFDNALRISCEKTGPVVRLTSSPDKSNTIEQKVIARHHCTFQGWESPEGQCDFPWALDEARTFKPTRHNI